MDLGFRGLGFIVLTHIHMLPHFFWKELDVTYEYRLLFQSLLIFNIQLYWASRFQNQLQSSQVAMISIQNSYAW